jgi:hypothetical protein
MSDWMPYIFFGSACCFAGIIVSARASADKFAKFDRRIAELERNLADCLDEITQLAAAYRAILGAVFRATSLDDARDKVRTIDNLYSPMKYERSLED